MAKDRTMLFVRRPMTARVIVVCAVALLASCTCEVKVSGRYSESRRGAISRVLRRDEELGAIRNERSRVVSIDVAASDYADAVEAIDFAMTPGAFESAYQRHATAWRALSDQLARHESWREMRGEMHDVFDRILATDESGVAGVRTRLDDVWATWSEVEAAASRYGVKIE
jgi:hypothetical protein